MDRTALTACALIVLLAQGSAMGAPPGADRVVLTVPRAPAADEALWLNVRLGVLERGARVLVLSDDGKLLGAISPFAIVPGQKAGTYTIPLPESSVREGRVAVRVVVEEAERVTRPSRRGEVEDVALEYVRLHR